VVHIPGVTPAAIVNQCSGFDSQKRTRNDFKSGGLADNYPENGIFKYWLSGLASFFEGGATGIRKFSFFLTPWSASGRWIRADRKTGTPIVWEYLYADYPRLLT
jgi:hypothetical protein